MTMMVVSGVCTTEKQGNEQYHVMFVRKLHDTVLPGNLDRHISSATSFIQTAKTIVTMWFSTDQSTLVDKHDSILFSSLIYVYRIIMQLLCSQIIVPEKDQLEVVEALVKNMIMIPDVDLQIIQTLTDVAIKVSFTTSMLLQSIEYNLQSLCLQRMFTSEGDLYSNPLLFGMKLNSLFGRELNNLVDLELSQSRLCDDFLITFSTTLHKNKNLERLCLSHNNFTDTGVIGLSKSLYYNDTLTELDISCNGYGAEGLYAITTSLRYNPTLTLLNVSTYIGRNRILELHLSKALLLLQYNEKIKTLFCWNHGDETVLNRTFRAIILYNQTLQRLNNHVKYEHKAPAFGVRRRQEMFISCLKILHKQNN